MTPVTCESIWNDMKERKVQMEPLFFPEPNCAGDAIRVAIGGVTPLPSFQSFVLPENVNATFYWNGAAFHDDFDVMETEAMLWLVPFGHYKGLLAYADHVELHTKDDDYFGTLMKECRHTGRPPVHYRGWRECPPSSHDRLKVAETRTNIVPRPWEDLPLKQDAKEGEESSSTVSVFEWVWMGLFVVFLLVAVMVGHAFFTFHRDRVVSESEAQPLHFGPEIHGGVAR